MRLPYWVVRVIETMPDGELKQNVLADLESSYENLLRGVFHRELELAQHFKKLSEDPSFSWDETSSALVSLSMAVLGMDEMLKISFVPGSEIEFNELDQARIWAHERSSYFNPLGENLDVLLRYIDHLEATVMKIKK